MFLNNPKYDHMKAYRDKNYNEPELLKPTPAHARAQAIGSALERFLEARKALKKEKKDVPDYTGQHDPEDYYAAEQEEYNRVLERLYQAMCGE